MSGAVTAGMLRAALQRGDPDEVAALLDAGADVRSTHGEGYDALIWAVHGRDVARDPRLLDLLRLLIARGAPLRGRSRYGESAVRVLSRLGRFDGVRRLLDAGADPGDVELTELIAAVAFGTLADVEAAAARGADLEARDYWERTAWLVAVQMGDLPKARSLLSRGAWRDARGRCGRPPLFYAIESRRPAMLRWLLEIGQDPDQTDEFGHTPLREAAEAGDAGAVKILLRAGADVKNVSRKGRALAWADTAEVVKVLLRAGADPQDLSSEGRRAVLGYPPETDPEALRVSRAAFDRWRDPRFGAGNPEDMTNPFWEGMIHSGLNAYQAAVRILGERDYDERPGPIWCADRFGQSLTFLPDGRIIEVAGEHEDFCDPDFCIYNDVFVHERDGRLTIYGYPQCVFPPTDFHTATRIGEHLYLIGCLGYPGTRQYGHTPVYRLNLKTFAMERLETAGEPPGWIYKHRAVRSGPHTIRVAGGTVVTRSGGGETYTENAAAYTLDVHSLIWSRG